MAELVHDAGLCDLTARDLASALASGRVSATEVLEATSGGSTSATAP